MDNMKKKFSGNMYAKYMWPAARAYCPLKHQYFMSKVLSARPDMEKWLNEHHSLLWARSKFSEFTKCHYINNNLAESWNSWIKQYKDLPVHCLADAIREKHVILFEKRRRISRALEGVILPAVLHQLNANSKGLGHLSVTKGHPTQVEVSEIYKDEVRRHVVYLDQHICTGKPCQYALAVITTTRNPNMEPFVDMAFSVQKFQASYAGVIPNITNRNQWPQVDKGFKLQPPIAKKRGVGRQRKNGILSCLERTGKATRQVKCLGCGQTGHRKGNWKCELTGTKKRKRTKKTKAKAGRKKAKKEENKKDHEKTSTPRTRATAAREAAAPAAQAATAAQELAAAQEPAASTSSGPCTRRKLASEEAASQDLVLAEQLPVEVIPPRR